MQLLIILILQPAPLRPKVLLNPTCMAALRNHARPPAQAPRQHHLRGRAFPVFRYPLDHVRRKQGLDFLVRGAVGRVRVAEGRVGGYVDALLGVVQEPGCLRQVWMGLKLVGEGPGGCVGVVEEVLELRGREVRDADVAGLTEAFEVRHCLPGLREGGALA